MSCVDDLKGCGKATPARSLTRWRYLKPISLIPSHTLTNPDPERGVEATSRRHTGERGRSETGTKRGAYRHFPRERKEGSGEAAPSLANIE